MSSQMDHLVICGYDPGSRMLLDAVTDEFGGGTQDVLIFAEGGRAQDIPPAFAWADGNPTKESELDKARIQYARAVIVVGPRGVAPEAADAQTILTIFTIRRYVAQSGVQRSKPLYLVAEVLDAENVSHARAAGADEVIETTKLGFSLLAHSVATPGSGQVLSEVAAANAHNIYLGTIPDEWEIRGDFGSVSQAIRERTGALVMGIHDDQERLNPADDTPIEPHMQLIYLAPRPLLPT